MENEAKARQMLDYGDNNTVVYVYSVLGYISMDKSIAASRVAASEKELSIVYGSNHIFID